MIRQLTQDDKNEALQLFKNNIETSFFLASNIEKAAMRMDSTIPFSGDYYGEFKDEKLIAAAAYNWINGILICAPEGGQKIINFMYNELKGKPLEIICGAVKNVKIIQQVFNLTGAKTGLNSEETVMSLNISDRNTFSRKDLTFRAPTQNDLDFLVQWLCDYDVEAIGLEQNEELIKNNIKKAQQKISDGRCILAYDNNTPVSFVGINADIDDLIQIGPVWTPLQHRNKGYARATTAALMQTEKQRGTTRALLFADNPAAIKAYKSVGFKDTGIKYGLCVFKQEQEIN